MAVGGRCAEAGGGGCAVTPRWLPCRADIERDLMAHRSSIRANYGDGLVPDLKAAIECIPDPLAHGDDNPFADAAE